MIIIDIPGGQKMRLEHLVLDYNGTLACDGQLLPGVRENLKALSGQIGIHVLTADTFGGAGGELGGIDCRVSIIDAGQQDRSKLQYVVDLGPDGAVCIGNGRNDRLMLREAALGIAVVQTEGIAAETLLAGDVVCDDINAALQLLINPLRLVATLRL